MNNSALRYGPRRPLGRALTQPRNMRDARDARRYGTPLVVSFVTSTPFGSPHVFCDSGERYDWSFVAGLQVIVCVHPTSNTVDALASMLEHLDVVGDGYPALVDLEREEVSFVVHPLNPGDPPAVWRVVRGTPLWQHYFPSGA